MENKRVGKVLGLFLSQEGISKRIREKKITLDLKGIIKDKFYDKDVKRSILLTSLESYTLAKSHQIEMPEAALGENILMDFNPYTLSAGQQVKIAEVILQISQNCTICEHLSSIDERLPTLLKHDRGIFAQVIKGGIIHEGDSISLVEEGIMMDVSTLLKNHIKKLDRALKSEEELIMILKKRLTKKEFKTIMMTVEGVSEAQQRQELSLDEKRFEAVRTKALKKVNFHELKEELMQKQA